MKKQSPFLRSKILLIAGMLALSISGVAQNPSLKVFEDWRSDAGSQNLFYRASAVTVPGTTNSIVCGATLNANGDYDVLVEKLSGAGAVLWSYQYDGPGAGDDVATDVYYDPSTGWTYVVGSYFESSADSFNAFAMGFKPSGSWDWMTTYNGTGSGADGFVSIAGDPSTGEIYCTGAEWEGLTSLFDVLLVKYDAGGSQQWTNTYDYSSMLDWAVRVVVGAQWAVTGAVQNAPTSFRLFVGTFDPSTGAWLSTKTSGGTAMGYDRASDIAMDDTGNVYLIGSVYNSSTWSDIRVTKYDTLLNVLWEYDIDAGYNMDDYGSGIALDSHNNVIISGTSKTVGNGMNYTVIKYNNAGGLIFYDSHNGSANGNDSATAVVVSQNDTDGIYVTGFSFNGSTNDYYTIRYDGVGSHIWEIGMNSIFNGDDIPTTIALDTLGDVIVSGQVKLADTVYAYTTVRYVQKNTLLPDDTIPYTSNSFVYVENRDQVWGIDAATHSEVKYYVNSSPKIFLMDTAVAYVFTLLDTSTIVTPVDTLSRVDMKFVNANADLRIRAMDERDDYQNFFLGHIPEGRSKVPLYNQLVSFNVWNNVDVVYGSNLAGMKHYFICKPTGGGSSVGQIDLYFDGADSVKIGPSGELIVYTPCGNLVQQKAAAWQIDAGGNFQTLGWQPSYNIIGTNEVAFTGLGAFNPALPLVFAIDWGTITPTTNQDNLWWSTAYGGGTRDNFRDVKVTLAGKQVVCGGTESTNFPTTTLTFQSTAGTSKSAVLVQFTEYNERDWATFYGGTSTSATVNFSVSTGLDVDPLGDIFFTGNTSNNDLPTQTWGGAYYQSTINNGCSTCPLNTDAFVAKVSSDGTTLIWSTYWGGDGDEVSNELHVGTIDPNNVYIGGSSTSTNNPFPNSAPGWSAGNGFFMMFDFLGVDLYGSMIGNSGTGSVMSIAEDQNFDVVLVGQVGPGSDLPTQLPASGNTGSATFASSGGTPRDAFITKISFAGTPSIVWSMYYGGTMNEVAHDVVTNPLTGGAIKYWVTGTASQGAISNGLPPLFDPGGGAYYDNSFNGGVGDAFVMCLDVNGNIPWATFYGGSGDDQGRSIDIDDLENIYVTGETSSSNLNSNGTFPSPNLSGGYVKTSPSGTYDFYLGVFASGTNVPTWGTYYGGGLGENTPQVATDGNSALYLTGGMAGTGTFPYFSGPGCAGPPPLSGTVYTDFTFTPLTKKASIASFCLGPMFVGTEESPGPALGVQVFPNPSEGLITISGRFEVSQDVRIEVYDVMGQLIYQETVLNSLNLNTTIDLSSYANGIYFINVNAGSMITTEKVVLQR